MKAVLESYDNRRPIIKRESLRGLFVKGKKTMNNEQPEYSRYLLDVHKLDSTGKALRDVNGNWVFLHRAGDVMLDENGDPVVLKWPSAVPNSILNRPPLNRSSMEQWSDKEFDDLFNSVLVEKLRRNAINPTTVASI